MHKKILLPAIILSFFLLSCHKSNDNPTQAKLSGWAIGSDYSGYGMIVKTSDGGKTWIRKGDSLTILTNDLSDVCILDDQTVLVCGGLKPSGKYTLLKTRDGGNTWYNVASSVLENANYTGLFALNHSEVWMVGDSGRIFHSTDAGESWIKLEIPAPYRSKVLTRIAALTSDDIWVVGTSDGENQYPPMMHSKDGGITWDTLNPLGDLNITQAIGGHYLGIKAVGKSIWAIGGFGKFVIRSGDGGITWSNISDPYQQGLADANDLFVLSETKAYVVYDYSGISCTWNSGASWTEYSYFTEDWYLGIAIISSNNIWVTGSPAGPSGYSRIIYSSDGGLNWQDQTPQLFKDKTSNIAMYKIRFLKN